MSLYSVTGDTMTGIADAVRNMRHEKQLMTPAQIEAKIRASRLGIPIVVSTHINPETGEWERPADWPDIDALAAQIEGDADCLYLTYDLRKTPGYGWIGIYARTADNSAWTATRGHVEGGAFVADESFSTASNDYFRRALNDAEGDVQLWRIAATGHITNIGFATNSAVNADNLQNNLQPCVQRAGTLPWCVRWAGTVGTGNTATCGGTQWMERDALVPGKNAVVTDLSSCWNGCYSLQSLDVSGWVTSGWAVTTLSSCWQNCYSLQSLDVSEWDTTGWAVTTLSYCWNGCYSLQSLDVSGWDTSGWAVTTLHSCWSGCYSLQSLDVSEWDTTGWAVTTLANCWQYCYSLQSLDVSEWDTTGWAVTTLSNCWQYCYSLQSLDVSEWDTTGWAVTTLANCWQNCYSLQSLDVSGWDTSGWTVTTLYSCWNGCYSLQSLDGTSEWAFVAGMTTNTNNPNLPNIEHFVGIPIAVNHSYNQALKLTVESLVNIIDALPTVSAARTLTLGQTNMNKLTAAQIAVATGKGWTVA